MNLALSLGRKSLGNTWPNPSVGCIIALSNQIVGRGRTGVGGRPHAETVAIEQAGKKTIGATAYVSLEPCSHVGKTSPCASAIISSGIKRVLTPIIDPDPRVSGNGIKALKEAGLEVHLVSEFEADAEQIIRGFIYRLKKKRPYITLKIATSLDGKLATGSGESKWISNSFSRSRVQLLRTQSDAILVGSGTILKDQPTLKASGNLSSCCQPLSIYLDAKLSLTLIGGKKLPDVVIHGPEIIAENKAKLEASSIHLIEVPILEKKLDLISATAALADFGVTNLLVEGGGQLASNLLKNDLIDRIVHYETGLILGSDGVPSFGRVFDKKSVLDKFPRFKLQSVRKLHNDVETIWDSFENLN